MLMQPSTDQSFRDASLEQSLAKLTELLEPSWRERLRVELKVRFGTAYYEIETYASEQGIELVVMGNVGRSAIANALLGSVTTHVLRHAPCPVLSVKH